MPDLNTDYIDSTNYKKLESKILNLKDIAFDLQAKSLASRKLRFAEIDIVAQRNAGKIAPDELYVPVHTIDSNIRREQSAYIQYITQSPRAVILKDNQDHSFDLSLLEVDLTAKLRYPKWQIPMYANIDGFQANGYGIMETVLDMTVEGNLATEYVQYGDFSFIADTRDVQKCEMIGRSYYFTKTKLKSLISKENNADGRWSAEQIDEIIKQEPNDELSNVYSGTTTINKSLYKLIKVMFKVKGIVQVGWTCPQICDDWVATPRPLFLGRRKLNELANNTAARIKQLPTPIQPNALKLARKLNPSITDKHVSQVQQGLPASDEVYETMYPYFLFPYLISENDTVANLKGRVFLDQDTQTAVSSLLSSTVTQARRASIMLFAKDTSDPNDDFLMEKNIQFKNGAIINGKLKEFTLSAPDPTMFNAINLLTSMNQQETSQVNYAETNRQGDSRKTATAVKAATMQAQQLSGVQVTLFSVALTELYTYMCEIIKSRVITGVIQVDDNVRPMYDRSWAIKPSGDVDVIEKQQIIQAMQNSWPIISNTPAAQAFLSDLLEKMFPDMAAKYINIFNQAEQQKQSQQGQMMQQAIGMAQQVGAQITNLASHPEFFSETGRVHAFPIIEQAAEKVKQLTQGQQK